MWKAGKKYKTRDGFAVTITEQPAACDTCPEYKGIIEGILQYEQYEITWCTHGLAWLLIKGYDIAGQQKFTTRPMPRFDLMSPEESEVI